MEAPTEFDIIEEEATPSKDPSPVHESDEYISRGNFIILEEPKKIQEFRYLGNGEKGVDDEVQKEIQEKEESEEEESRSEEFEYH